MRHHQHRQPAFGDGSEQAGGLEHMAVVQAARRLVEDEDLLAAGKRRGYGHSLLLPSRKRHGMPVLQTLEIKAPEDLLEAGYDALAGGEQNLLAHGRAEELVVHVLHHDVTHGEALPLREWAGLPEKPPHIRFDEPCEAARERRFSRAVPSQDGRHTSHPHIHAGDVQGGDEGAPIGEAHVGTGYLPNAFPRGRRSAFEAAGKLAAQGAQAGPRPVLAAHAPDVLQRHLADEPPVLDENRLVRHAVEVSEPVLGDEDGRAAALQTRNDRSQGVYRPQVEVGRGFVEDVHARRHRGDAGERDCLLLSSGQLEYAAAFEFRDPRLSERLVHPPGDFFSRKPHVLAAERHLGRRVGGVELRAGILEHGPDDARQLPYLAFEGVFLGYRDGSGERTVVEIRNHAVHEAQGGRLPAPALPAKHHALPGANAKREIPQGRGAGTFVGKRRMAELDHHKTP